MEKAEANEHKPHCLILPYPIQGHINPMIQFSKRLADKGITITFAATKALLNSTHDFPRSISVDTISDGYDQGKGSSITLPEYRERFEQVGKETLCQLLQKLQKSGCPVDCVVYDPFLPWGLAVAKSFGLFGAAFFTQACYVNIIYYQIYKGLLRIPVLDREILIPGLPTLEISDMPSFVLDQDKYPGSLQLLVDQFQGVEDADFVFVNSVYELEEEVL